jgi:hypothetical protein
MKVGDLVQHKRRGWMALVLEINDRNKSADIMWLEASRLPNRSPSKFDNFSMSLLKVINEAR